MDLNIHYGCCIKEIERLRTLSRLAQAFLDGCRGFEHLPAKKSVRNLTVKKKKGEKDVLIGRVTAYDYRKIFVFLRRTGNAGRIRL